MSQFEIEYRVENPAEEPEEGILLLKVDTAEQAEYEAKLTVSELNPDGLITIVDVKELPENG